MATFAIKYSAGYCGTDTAEIVHCDESDIEEYCHETALAWMESYGVEEEDEGCELETDYEYVKISDEDIEVDECPSTFFESGW